MIYSTLPPKAEISSIKPNQCQVQDTLLDLTYYISPWYYASHYVGYINVCTKEFVKRKEREIAQSRKLRKQLEEEDDKKLVRKRKPIQFTMQDLEADAELEGDDEFMEYFNTADVL